MKIADSDSIKLGEQILITSIMEKLNPKTLSSLDTKNLSPENVEFVDGDMVIWNDRIVYKMDLKVTIDMSVMFDRDGNLVVSENNEDLDSHDEELDDDGESPRAGHDDELLDSAMAGSPESLEEDMDQIFKKTREFWQVKSIKALESESLIDETTDETTDEMTDE